MPAEIVPMGRRPHRVVTASPLGGSARRRLEELLGTDVELVDIVDASGSEGLVVVGPVSPQLIGKLHAAFPHAKVVVTEVEDDRHGIRLGGPVTRALDGGADGYYVSRSIEEFAALLKGIDASRIALDATRPAELLAAEQDLDQVIELLLRRQAEAAVRREEGSE